MACTFCRSSALAGFAARVNRYSAVMFPSGLLTVTVTVPSVSAVRLSHPSGTPSNVTCLASWGMVKSPPCQPNPSTVLPSALAVTCLSWLIEYVYV